MKPPQLVIPLIDYERIFQVIFSVIDNHAETPHACIFFSIVGAMILKTNYKINAVPIAGAAAYLTDSANSNVVTFGKFESNGLKSYDDAFHCWIEADGIVIDLLAPLFEESIRNYGHDLSVPKRMFQKPKAAMASSLTELRNNGDFFLLPNIPLSRQLFTRFQQRVTATDLANVCLTWYARPPKPLESMAMINDLGDIESLTLRGPRLTSAW